MYRKLRKLLQIPLKLIGKSRVNETMHLNNCITVLVLSAGWAASTAAAGRHAPGEGPTLNVPDWDWEPNANNTLTYCLPVPTVKQKVGNVTVQWPNNSRLLLLAVPEGTPPPGGWPVMLDFNVVDFNAAVLTFPYVRTCSPRQSLSGLDCSVRCNADRFLLSPPPTTLHPPCNTRTTRMHATQKEEA